MFRVIKKQYQVKRALSKWCKEQPALNQRIEDARAHLDRLQVRLRNESNDPVLFKSEKSARKKLRNLLRVKESMMKQKSRDKTLNLGDSNTKYFYSLLNANRKRSFKGLLMQMVYPLFFFLTRWFNLFKP